MTGDIPRSVWSGSFVVFGVELKCHVLDNGQRIIEAESVAAFLEALASPDKPDIGDMDGFTRWRARGP